MDEQIKYDQVLLQAKYRNNQIILRSWNRGGIIGIQTHLSL